MAFNSVDIAIAVLVFISAIIGFARGFVREAISLATWLGAIILALMFYETVANMIPIEIDKDIIKNVLAGVIIFTVVLIIGSIINFFFSRIVEVIGLGAIDRILGGAFGILRGLLIVTLIVFLLKLGFTNLTETDYWKKSASIPKFEEAAAWIKEATPPDAERKVYDFLERLGIDTSSVAQQPSPDDASGVNSSKQESL